MASPLVAGAIALMMSEEKAFHGGKLCHKPGYFKSKVSSPAVKIAGNYPLLYIGGTSYIKHASCSNHVEGYHDSETASEFYQAETNSPSTDKENPWTFKQLMDNFVVPSTTP